MAIAMWPKSRPCDRLYPINVAISPVTKSGAQFCFQDWKRLTRNACLRPTIRITFLLIIPIRDKALFKTTPTQPPQLQTRSKQRRQARVTESSHKSSRKSCFVQFLLTQGPLAIFRRGRQTAPFRISILVTFILNLKSAQRFKVASLKFLRNSKCLDENLRQRNKASLIFSSAPQPEKWGFAR